MTTVLIGGVNVDVLASAAGALHPGVSNPGRIRITAGGAARNVAENLARLGVRTHLVAAVDVHPLADLPLEQAARAGVDTSAVIRTSGGNYYAAIAAGGMVQWAVSDMSAAEALTPGDLDARASLLHDAAAVVVDANLHPSVIARACELAAGSVLCLLPVSEAKAHRVRAALPRASLVVLSVREAEVLIGKPIRTPRDALRAASGLKPEGGTVVITMAEQGLGWVGTEEIWVESVPVTVVDPAGAGDAAAAVGIYGLLTSIPPAQAAHLAMVASAMTVSVEGANHPGLSLDALHAWV